MALSYVSDQGVFKIPGSYPSITVENTASNLAVNGVIAIIGEASAGPAYTQVSDITAQSSYGPDEFGTVQALYKSGRIVDAFRGMVNAANDPNIQGSFNRVLILKTNESGKASSNLLKIGGGTYGTLSDANYGQLGNLIFYSTTATSEVKPTTGAFTLLSPIGTVNISLRASGGVAGAVAMSAAALPPAFVSSVNAIAGTPFAATGGTDRSVLTSVAGTVAMVATGNNVTVTFSGTWANTPVAGDLFYIAPTTALTTGHSNNAGSYQVTAATSNTLSATKILDATGTPGTLTAPSTVTTQSVASTTDVRCFAPVTVTLTGSTLLAGAGKSLEINELATGTDLFSRVAYTTTGSQVTWISTSATPTQLTSATEYAVELDINRQADNLSAQVDAGGKIAISIGYIGTTGSMTISSTSLTTTVTGGAGANLSITLADYPTLSDLATYINSQPGYICRVQTVLLGQFPPTALDEGTFSIGTTFGNYTGRIKMDAASFFDAVKNQAGGIVTFEFPTSGTVAGLPDVTSGNVYLAGGSLGGTTEAQAQAAIDALDDLQLNFVVPLFSQDASEDILENLTDSTSTYGVDSINAAVKAEVNRESKVKNRRNRQGFCSKRATFLDDQEAATNLAAYRVSLAFQDMKDLGSNGIQQFQPWMTAAKAAAMQAAGFYRSIMHKGISCSGVLQAAGDFNPNSDSQLEDALNAGLLVAMKTVDGGFIFVSDQTTYSKDNSFYFNSIQAIYDADIVALTSARRMETAFVGASLADVSASLAKSAFETILADLFRIKLLAASDDNAPQGFKDVTVKIQGNVMLCSANIKLASAIAFIPINFTVSQVTQSA